MKAFEQIYITGAPGSGKSKKAEVMRREMQHNGYHVIVGGTISPAARELLVQQYGKVAHIITEGDC